LSNKDIDSTADRFLIYFKEKYLKNIQFDTQANIKNLLKHSLDIYRSKGTERSIDLLFRAVFGVPASVYYPGDDIFRLSDGKWHIPTYLEISLKKDSEKLIGKQIVGASSGATAFAEALVRKTVKGRLVDVLYISAVNGFFLYNEPLNTSDNVIAAAERPIVIGSMTDIIVDINGTGANYSVGDIVDVYSDYGEQGKGVVRGISNTTGQISFSLENGGYAYRANAEVLVSEKVALISNLNIGVDNNGKDYVYVFDQFVEPLANITYSAITTNVANGIAIYSYHPNNDVKGTGKILVSTPITATTGNLIISVLSGSFDAAALYTTSNAVSLTVDVYANATVIANTIGYYSNVIIGASNKNGNYNINEEVFQVDQYGLELANGKVALVASLGGTNVQLKIANTYGVFRKDKLIKGRASNASANVQNTAIYVGIRSVSNTLYKNDGNYVYFANSLSNGTINVISTGSLANVSFSNSLLYTETVPLSNDYISTNASHYLPIVLNAATYDFPLFPSGNLTNGTLSQMFNSDSYTIGKIQQLTAINKGMDYILAPIVKIYDPITTSKYRQDLVLNVTGVSGLFDVGEVVTQTSVNSRGIVKTANSTEIWVEQLRILPNNNFTVTSNSTTILVGSQSSTTANITLVDTDFRSQYLGFNANISSTVQVGVGSVTNVTVFSSGFGYIQDDSLRFVRAGESYDNEDAGLGFAVLINQGMGEGYYKKNSSWLSDKNKLFDGMYYQEYSYEIRSSITLNKYESMLREILHVSGTKYFGALVYKTNAAVDSAFIETVIVQT